MLLAQGLAYTSKPLVLVSWYPLKEWTIWEDYDDWSSDRRKIEQTEYSQGTIELFLNAVDHQVSPFQPESGVGEVSDHFRGYLVANV